MLENIHKTAAFTLRNRFQDTGLRNRVRHLFVKPIEQLISLDRCNDLYDHLPEKENLQQFFGSILRALDVTVLVNEKEKSAIPKTGPLVVVSNHPFGAIEGIILAELFLSIRPDIKVMANSMLNRIARMNPLLIPVNPFKSSKSAHANIGSIRYATQWVNQGGVLLIFPSGAVSHFHFTRREISDPPWNPVAGKIVRKTQAPVLPVYFSGSNGKLFQVLGMVHPWLRTALLPRELLNKRRRRIEMKIGNVLPYGQLKKFDGEDRLTPYLRWRTYLLGNTAADDSGWRKKNPTEKAVSDRPVAAALDSAICRMEVDRLPRCQQLVKSGPNTVWLAQSGQIPRLLLEIARLRELSFRRAGEGTGQMMDMDAFDAHYLHLFIWNDETNEIIGAYRLGCTDKILANFGPSGLYTSTLFHSHRDFHHKIGPAIELGRSFVKPEYQKTFAPLLLLWRGIGHYIAKNPKYRTLYGPVSISRDYCDFSRNLMASSLMRHHRAEGVIDMVRPQFSSWSKPIRLRGCETGWETEFCRDMDEINSAIREIEADHKGIPILLKHYLKLGGRLIAFNEDKNFNEALDGLIVVDLFQTDRRTLTRYMGADGATFFVNYHTFLSDNGSETVPLPRTA
ncbi:MAG: GNAT family N-acyltransferase [Pseudomonadota bacterium]